MRPFINLKNFNLQTEVLVTGTFNILHAGHIELLEFSQQFGKVTVGLNSDSYLETKYGNNFVPLIQRAKVVKACRYVDNVMVFNESNPSDLIRKLKPKYYIRGPDYRNVELIEQAALTECNTTLIICPNEKINSSSELIKKIHTFRKE